MKLKYLPVTISVGIACATLSMTDSAKAMNLVTNGGFETGNFTGWTQSGNTNFTGVSTLFRTTPTLAITQLISDPLVLWVSFPNQFQPLSGKPTH
jgi:hypothetical protein